MTLTQHLAVTGVAAAALSPFLNGEEILLFSAGSVLIDVDHYLLYVQRTQRLDIRGMFRYFDEEAFRFNEREGDDTDRFLAAMSEVSGKRVTYKKLTGKDDD